MHDRSGVLSCFNVTPPFLDFKDDDVRFLKIEVVEYVDEQSDVECTDTYKEPSDAEDLLLTADHVVVLLCDMVVVLVEHLRKEADLLLFGEIWILFDLAVKVVENRLVAFHRTSFLKEQVDPYRQGEDHDNCIQGD